MHHAIPLITTVVGGLMLTFTLGMLTNKLCISPLVGHLLVGVLAGLFTSSFVANTRLTLELAELGVILLMFGVGLHFSLKDLMAVKAIAIPGTIAQTVVATLLGMVLPAVLGRLLMTGIVFGLCPSTTSIVVLLHALEERQLIDSQRGQIAVGWLIAKNLVMVLMLVLLPVVAGMVGQGDVGFATLAASMGITIGKVIAPITIMILVGRRLVPWITVCNATTGSRELFTLSVLTLALGIAFGAVKLFDVPFTLGAFSAGMIPNESELSHRAAHDTLSLRDAFAVLFFVSIGMLLDPLILIQQPLAVLTTLVIILLGKSLAVFFLVRLFGYSQCMALTITANLVQIGEFAFILAGLGMALNSLPQVGQNLVPAGAILSIMFSLVLPVLLEKHLAKTETLEKQTLEEATEEEKRIPVDIYNHALLVGYSRVDSLPREKLLVSDIPLVVIETSRTRTDELRERGVRAVLGDAVNEEIVQLAHPEYVKWLIPTIPNDYEAGKVVVSARAKDPDIEITARAHYDDEVTYITERGANQAVMGEREIARTMLESPETPPADEVVTG